MLSPAETDLVRRDPAVPGLAVVLDPDAFVAALRQAAPGLEVRAAHITYSRYKPRTYCRVTYRLDIAGTEVEAGVRACRPDDLTSGSDGILLKEHAVVVTVFPDDLKLTQLRHLTDADERQPLLRELLPDRPDLWPGQLRCLRYRPERRYVAELRAADESRALVKCYTARAYVRGKRNAVAFQSRGPLRIAHLLGCADKRRLLA